MQKNYIIGKKSNKNITQSTKDRLSHTHILGNTGCGKSVLMKEMILQDIENGHEVFVIEPHGDLTEDVLQSIPSKHKKNISLYEPLKKPESKFATSKFNFINLYDSQRNGNDQKNSIIPVRVTIVE